MTNATETFKPAAGAERTVRRLTIWHPNHASHFKQRNGLLQEALRPEPLPFAIATEYPIVLGEDGASFSYCAAFTDDPKNQIVAHANLWPRSLWHAASKRTIPVGLVGNVATAQGLRGQGVMTSLLDHLEERGKILGLTLLILWSDLDLFYQKLGFSSLGSEQRLLLRPLDWAPRRIQEAFFQCTSAAELSEMDLVNMLNSRQALDFELERSPAEFRQLLTIPETDIFVQRGKEGRVSGYILLGKGYDMKGVIHEWGASRPADLLSGIRAVAEAKSLEQLMILMPPTLLPPWQQSLQKFAVHLEKTPMALAKGLSKASRSDVGNAEKQLESCFIWGLDSI